MLSQKRSIGLDRRRAARAAAPRAARSGFTLVEMLVVVAVILLLLAIALPAFHLAQSESQKVTCLSRLHQQSLAALAYANENKKTLPPLNATISGVRATYADFLVPYMYGPIRYEDRNSDGSINHLDTDPFYADRMVFRCPTAERIPLRNGSYSKWLLDYGGNHYGFDTADPQERKNFIGTVSGLSLNEVADYSVVYLADAEAEYSPQNIGGVSRGKGRMDWPLQVSFNRHAFVRHVGGYNSVSLDGSATWTRGDVPSNERWFIRRVR